MTIHPEPPEWLPSPGYDAVAAIGGRHLLAESDSFELYRPLGRDERVDEAIDELLRGGVYMDGVRVSWWLFEGGLAVDDGVYRRGGYRPW